MNDIFETLKTGLDDAHRNNGVDFCKSRIAAAILVDEIKITAKSEIYIASTVQISEVVRTIILFMASLRKFYNYCKSIIYIDGDDRQTLDGESLKHMLNSEGATFFTFDRENVPRYQFLPIDFAKTILIDKRKFQFLKTIDFFSDIPSFDKEFRLLSKGYDSKSKIFCTSNEIPLRADTTRINQLLEDFKFKNEGSRQNFIGLLILAALRNHFVGDKPIAAFTGNRPQLGKTLLCKILNVLFWQDKNISINFTLNHEELEKKVASILKHVDGLFMDNVREALIESPVLEVLATALNYSFRELGKNQTISGPNTVIVMMTVNNAQFNADLTTRILPIELHYPEDKDLSKCEFKIADIVDFTTEHREELLGEILGMINRWAVAGQPTLYKLKRTRFKKFETLVGSILCFNGFELFLSNWDEAKASYNPVLRDLGKIFQAHINIPIDALKLVSAARELFLFKDIVMKADPSKAMSSLVAKYIGQLIPVGNEATGILEDGPWDGHNKKKSFVVRLMNAGTKVSADSNTANDTRAANHRNDNGKDSDAGRACIQTPPPENLRGFPPQDPEAPPVTILPSLNLPAVPADTAKTTTPNNLFH